MRIVFEHRRKHSLLFVIFVLALVWVLFQFVVRTPSVSESLVLSVALLAFLALSFFSFQSIFYKREIEISTSKVLQTTYLAFQPPQRVEVSLEDFKQLALRWVYLYPFGLKARLHLILEHKSDPNYSVVLDANKAGSSEAEMRKRAQELSTVLGNVNWVDESA